MVLCPNCRSVVESPQKTWKYGIFHVEAYICGNCGTVFREYTREGKHVFTLKLVKGKGFIKA